MGFRDWLNSGTEEEKRKKRLYIVAGILGLFILLWISSDRQNNHEPEAEPARTGSEFFTLEERKVWVTRFEKELEDINKKIEAVAKDSRKILSDLETRQKKWQTEMEEKIKELEEKAVSEPTPSARPGAEEWPPELGIIQPAPIQIYSPAPEEERKAVVEEKAPVTEKAPPRGTLPAGAFARSTLLTGIDAPTSGQPYPVVLLVNEPFTGPNSTQIPLKGCLVIGKAEGSLSSERAIIQLTRISCALDGARPVEQEINGYAVDRDGRLGLKGKVVSKSGRKIALSLLANFAAGVGAAIHEAEVDTIYNTETGNVITVPTGSIARAAVGAGLARSAEDLSRFFLEQAREIFPVVEVEAGRSSYVIIQSGIEIEGLEVASNHAYYFSDSD